MKEITKKVYNSFINKKNIKLHNNWLEKIANISDGSLKKELLKINLNEKDNEKLLEESLDAKKYNNLFSFENKKEILQGYFLCQINSYSNVAQSNANSNNNNYKEDEEELIDDEFLNYENEVLSGNDPDDKGAYKSNKRILKFSMSIAGLSSSTNNLNNISAFEHSYISGFDKILESEFPKIIIGPKCEIRRGIMYLDNTNVQFI